MTSTFVFGHQVEQRTEAGHCEVSRGEYHFVFCLRSSTGHLGPSSYSSSEVPKVELPKCSKCGSTFTKNAKQITLSTKDPKAWEDLKRQLTSFGAKELRPYKYELTRTLKPEHQKDVDEIDKYNTEIEKKYNEFMEQLGKLLVAYDKIVSENDEGGYYPSKKPYDNQW